MTSVRAELYARLPLLDTDAWWLEQARTSPDGRVVELGAGAGRLTVALADAGARVTAVEHDPDMLVRLRERAGDRVEVVEADVADASGIEPAGVVVLPGSLLNELSGPDRRRAALRTAAGCCRADGTVALHLLGPWWLARLRGRSAGRLVPADGGAPVEVVIDAGDLDPWRGRRRATLTYAFADGQVLTDRLDAAVVTPAELEDDLGHAGLEVVEAFGAAPPDDPVTVDAPALHVRCRPAGTGR